LLGCGCHPRLQLEEYLPQHCRMGVVTVKCAWGGGDRLPRSVGMVGILLQQDVQVAEKSWWIGKSIHQ
jgi:hypothetical protein